MDRIQRLTGHLFQPLIPLKTFQEPCAPPSGSRAPQRPTVKEGLSRQLIPSVIEVHELGEEDKKKVKALTMAVAEKQDFSAWDANGLKTTGDIVAWSLDWEFEMNEDEKALSDHLVQMCYPAECLADLRVLDIAFVINPVGSRTQVFHLDFEGGVEVIFVPFIDLDETNGTEYVEFKSIRKNWEMIEKLWFCPFYLTHEHVNKHMKRFGVEEGKDYDYKQVKTSAWDVVKVNSCAFHRGVKNRGTQKRIMLRVSTTFDPEWMFFESEPFIPDSQMDEVGGAAAHFVELYEKQGLYDDY